MSLVVENGASAARAVPRPDVVPHDEDEDWREGRIHFRVRVGAIGHRDPVRPHELEGAIARQLELIEAEFAQDGGPSVYFTVVSSLADGADRLIVDTLSAQLGKDRLDLHAVLPMDEDEYRKDFSPSSAERFDALLGHAKTVSHTVPTRDRDEAYERAGRWVVEHSDVVIALWDGREASGRGGTAEIVRYAHSRGIPVLVVPTTRARWPNRQPLPAPWPNDLAGTMKSARRACARIQEFNRGSVKDGALRRQLESADAQLSAAADGSAIHWQYRLAAAWALPRLARADLLAMKYQRQYYRAGQLLYGLAALAVTVVAAQAEAGISDKVAIFEVAMMATLIAVYRVAHTRGYQERWINYRSLAEAFRSALFIVMTGAPARRDAATSDLGPEEEWSQRAFSEAWMERPTCDRSGQPPAVKRRGREASDLRRFLTEAWINDQVAYHSAAVRRFHRGYQRLTLTIFSLFFLTIVIGLLHAFEVVPGETWRHLFIFLAVALPSFGAALTGIRDLRQFRRHADRSARTAKRLQQLSRNMETQRGLRSVQRLAAQVNGVIQAENSDWLDVLEFQDLEMVI